MLNCLEIGVKQHRTHLDKKI